MSFTLTLTTLLVAITACATSSYGTRPTYTLTDAIVGPDFFRAFDFQAISDPTHGRVTYVDRATAQAHNLTYSTSDTFVLRADHTTRLADDGTGPGRESVRIRSKRVFTHHVAVFDIRHMPQGCGTWPAVWETKESNWPEGGEIDILEGVNNQAPNSATLHTTAGCTMPPQRDMSGTPLQNDCDWTVNFNTGCRVRMDNTRSFGPAFNDGGGGWFAVQRTDEHIKVWFWPRHDARVPRDVLQGARAVDPDRWGLPAAYFPDTQCDLEKHFQENNIIINLTFCGDWAGNADVYAASGCPLTCEEFVADPTNFVDAYFDFAAIRIYE